MPQEDNKMNMYLALLQMEEECLAEVPLSYFVPSLEVA